MNKPVNMATMDLSSDVNSVLPSERGLYWGGCWHNPQGAKLFSCHNPSTGSVLGEAYLGRAEDVDAAVTAARAALPAWSRTPPLERGKCLRAAASRVREFANELALADAAGCGNPVKAMIGDAEMAAAQLDYFAGIIFELKGETIPTHNNSLDYTLRQPVGVVGRIFPFNHPFMFAASKMAAPLAAGNTVVIKPPEQAPLSTIKLIEILQDIFPAGVLNCVTGDRTTGAALASHPGLAAIGLVGSVPAGKAVLHSAADTMKRALLELGGKNAMVIFPDADLEAAVDGAVRGMNFTWCGQSCGSTSRLFLHDSIHDQFVAAMLVKLAATYRPGIATDMGTTMGALSSRDQYDRTLNYVEIGKAEGASLALGGKRPDDPKLEHGFFIEPTVFVDVTPGMRIAKEEIFGPVLSVIRWHDEDALFEAVNGVEFGLTCSIWTRDLRTAHASAARVEAGYVWINDCATHFLGAPFGGVKQSGIGREESKEELFEFTNIKNVNVNLD